MHPILFKVPGLDFPITTFGLMVVIGFLAGSALYTRVGLRYERDREEGRRKLDAVPVWVLVGVILGARLMYVVVEVAKGTPTGRQFVEKPETVLFVFQGGLVMYGGALGGILGGWWATRKHGLPFTHLVDIGMLGAFLGLTIGRVGCLLVGDDYGARVPEGWQWLPFPVVITVPETLPEGSLFDPLDAGHKLWGTQLWLSANAGLLCLVGLRLLRRRRYRGQVTLWMLALYALTRFVIEFFRGDKVRGLWFGGALSTSQILSIVIGLASVGLLVRWRHRRDPDAGLPPPEGAAQG